MENASKALIMAASILIAVMLISLGTYLFVTFGDYSRNINEQLSQTEINEFNTQFLKYETDQYERTPYDIVTIINLAKDCNNKNGYNTNERPDDYANENNRYVYVNLPDGTDFYVKNEACDNSKLNGFIYNKIGNTKKYKCEVNLSSKTGLVKSVEFTVQN